MPCYGVETEDITNAAGLLREIPDESVFLVDEMDVFRFADQYHAVNLRIAQAYLASFVCFLAVLHSVMDRKVKLCREFEDNSNGSRAAHLEGYLPIYARATEWSSQLLQRLLLNGLENNPVAAAIFVLEIKASETVSEMVNFVTSVSPATTFEEVNEHGEIGKEITDSTKGLIKKTLSRGWFSRFGLGEDRIEKTLHAINEVLSIFFRGGQ